MDEDNKWHKQQVINIITEKLMLFELGELLEVNNCAQALLMLKFKDKEEDDGE